MSLRYAYCNLQIFHYGVLRNKLTKEPVDVSSAPSCEELERSFKTSLQAWEASEPCKQLRSVLVSLKTPLEVNKIIGFACGPMSMNYDERQTQRSLFQNALILTLWDVLSKTKGHADGIRCYAQDPAYTEVDKLVLEGSDITVLDDPEGFLEVDNSTVVFSCAPNVPVRQIISDIALPAIMIWDKIKEDAKESDEITLVYT